MEPEIIKTISMSCPACHTEQVITHYARETTCKIKDQKDAVYTEHYMVCPHCKHRFKTEEMNQDNNARKMDAIRKVMAQNNISPDYDVTIADRIRTMTNAEMSDFFANWLTGFVQNILKDTGYELQPNIDVYKATLQEMLAKITSETPRMYTVDDLKTMRGDRIYIYHVNASAGFYKDMYVPYFGNKQCYIEDSILGLTSVQLPLSHYGASWIAFTYQPKEAENKTLPIAEKLSEYDNRIFANMTTCQLVNEKRRLETRMTDPEVPDNLLGSLTNELNIVNTELARRNENDVL